MKNIFRKAFIAVFLGFFTLFSLHGRGINEGKTGNLTIYSLKGSPGVGMIRLFEEPPSIPGFQVRVEALAQADLMAAAFISGEAKVGILPPNVAAKIASSGRDLRAAAIVGTGMLSLLSSDSSVRSLGDLRGKTVEIAGQGATPEYVFRKILSSGGLVPETDVSLGYSLAPPEISQSLIAGRISLGLIPEPFATMARQGRPDLISVADIQGEWMRAVDQGNYPMTLLVIDGEFADANPVAIDIILDRVSSSIEWVLSNPIEAGSLVEKHDLGLRAPIVTASIPQSGYVFIPAVEGRSSLEALFRVFLEFAPVSIGGVLPGDRFYHK